MEVLRLAQWDAWEVALIDADFEKGDYNFYIGGLRFNIENLDGQCGAAVLCEFEFTDKAPIPTADQFTRAIKNAAKGKVAILIASAVVGSRLHEFLDNYPWSKGAIARNPNSGNDIQIFELKV